MREIFVSTGTMVARENGFDYRRASRELVSLYSDGLCSGSELMMLEYYYDKRSEVISAYRDSEVPFPVIHCEKDIGAIISRAAILSLENKKDEAEALYKTALSLYGQNLQFAEEMSIPRMVLHLWGGRPSDANIGYNVEKHHELSREAEKHGVTLLIENIPSAINDPLSNWKRLIPTIGNSRLVFDSRFGKLHEQIDDIFRDRDVTSLIRHVHISDFGGTYRDFSALRPILHPCEGTIDFPALANKLDSVGYSGSFTLESPVNVGEELDTGKLRRTLAYLAELFLGEAER